MIHCNKCDIQPVPVDQLPVLLPRSDGVAKGHSALVHNKEFLHVNCPKWLLLLFSFAKSLRADFLLVVDAVEKLKGRRTQWIHLSIQRGIFYVIWIPITLAHRLIHRKLKELCLSISTLAGKNMVRFT